MMVLIGGIRFTVRISGTELKILRDLFVSFQIWALALALLHAFQSHA